MKYKPLPQQKGAIKHGLKNPGCAFFLDPGDGKTSATLAVVDILKRKKMIKGVFVFMTMNILDLDTWQNEIQKWEFDFTYTVLHGKHKDRELKKKYDFYFINYEGLYWLYQNKKKWKGRIDMLVLDESTRVKGYRFQRFKMFKKLRHCFKRVIALTGTPAPQSLIDLFSQVYLLDEGERLGRFITQYRNEYFFPSGFHGYKYLLQEGAEKRIYKKIKDIVYRPSQDYLKLPKEKYNDIEIVLPDKLMAQYKELEDEFIAELDSGTVTALTAGAMTQKLRQFSNGRIYDEYKNVLHVHDYKLDLALDVAEELQGNPMLIGYEFRHDLQALQEAFPKAPFFGTTLEGKKPNKKRKLEIQTQWNAGHIPILLGQISAVAHGLNLQESGHNLFIYSHIYILEDVIQFVRRLRRQGQKKRVMVHRPICKDTIDEDIIAVQARKNQTQTALLDAMRKRIKKRRK